ncbi:MAG TPA: hypothetical protein P5320_02640 [Bacteroidales bacterium]|nr:hypothetical protein [Bacteroidales bacterium]HOK74355.1 hypothetical protein [Bacteroidales bacterium]HOM41041.1 hypothetical protein [Bacteroidales bacterium]HPP92109.1 hypothetical protein [Bacteroidales bacterium]HQK70026.1 hypothetical protein [Bacteroidales bacterium]
MEKFFFIIIFLGNLSKIAYGQNEEPISKGNLLTGGSFSCNIQKTKEYEPITGTKPRLINVINNKEFHTELNFGYFITNHVVSGLKTDIFILFNKNTFPQDTSLISIKNLNSSLTVGPFIRYYTKSGIFFEGSVTIGLFNLEADDYIKKWKGYSLCVGIGYSIFISKSVAIEPEITYLHLNYPSYGILENKIISSGLSFSFGFQVYINTKSKLLSE